MEPQFVTGIDHTDPAATSDSPVPARPRWLRGFSPAEAVVALVAFTVLLAVAVGAGWLVYTLAVGVVGLLEFLGGLLGQVGGWVLHGPITRTITDPVSGFFDGQGDVTPATPRQLWTTWLGAGGVLWAVAVTGGRGARIGWAVFGLVTAVFVYAGARSGGMVLDEGVTALAWAVLSIPAYRRIAVRRPTVTPAAPPARTAGARQLPADPWTRTCDAADSPESGA